MRCQPTFLPPSSPDSAARRRLSAFLRQFALRRCDGDQLTEWYQQVAQTTDDPTLQKLLDDQWLFIQEADEWTVTSADTWANVRRNGLRGLIFVDDSQKAPQMSKEDRKAIARWILYLRSGQTYKWPMWTGRARVFRAMGLILMWVSFGLIKFRGLRDEEYVDVNFYPFASKEEYEGALKSPHLLCGK